MGYLASFSSLKAFAEKSLNASKYPDDYHIFKTANCPTCGPVPFELTFEHHSGSKKNDFKGMIFGRCAECDKKTRIFSFTGQHRKLVRETKPVCKCGSKFFLVGECERIEGDKGVMGFFDEGVVVGKCVECSQDQAFIFTD
jgi:hypothetical protein